METPKPHREQFEGMLSKHVEQKQALDQLQSEEAVALKDVAHEEALKDNLRIEQLREEMTSITGKKEVQTVNENEKEISHEQLRKDWQDFYREMFQRESDFSKIKIPEKKEGFERLVIVEKGVTAQNIFDKCVELFSSYKSTDKSLDEIVTSDRSAVEQAYAIWVRERIEADEELKDVSAKGIAEKGIITETLEERLLDEIKYFKQTGKHLDVANVTLCTGSRYSGGDVPSVRWDSGRGRLGVRRCDSGDALDYLRSRQVVS
jgi:hypothetical protein